MKKHLLFALLCLVATTPLFAADDSPAADDTFVSLTRTPIHQSDLPTNVTVITADQIQQQGARNLAEALELAPGIQITNTGSIGSFASVRIRGVPSSSQVQILIDDQPLGGVSIQNIDISLIPVDNIERIEVVRGGASVLYGANTIGGVIHVITKKHTTEEPTAALTMQQGSLNTSVVNAEAGAKTDHANAYASVGQLTTNGYQDNTDVQHRDGSLTSGYAFENGAHIQADVSSFGNEGGTSSGTPVPFDQWNGHLEREANTPTARFDHTIDTARLNAGVPLGQIGSASISSYGSKENYESDFFESRYENRVEGGDMHASLFRGTMVGGSYEKNSRESEDQVNHHADNWAFYAQQEARWSKWLFIPAVRYDHHSQFGGTTNPRLTTVFQASPDFKISANAARSYRAPTLTDLYEDFPDTFDPSFDFFANPNLKPETAWTYDLGFESRIRETSTVQVTGFYTRIKDRITGIDTNGNFAADTLANLGLAEMFGAEIEGSQRFDAWDHQINLTLQRGQGTTPTSTQFVALANIPHYIINYDTALHLPHRWTWRNTIHFQGKSFEASDDEGTEMASYYTWNTRFEKIIGNANLFIEARNLTDRLYSESTSFSNDVPLPGRTFDGGVKLTFGR